MPNMIFSRDACRQIVSSGMSARHKDLHGVDHGESLDWYQPLIQVEIIKRGSYASGHPTWRKEDGWTNRRWAEAYVLDEDGGITQRIVKVYSTMTVDDDWTNTDAEGGLNSSNQARYFCVLMHGRWHLLSPLMLQSAVMRLQWSGLQSGGENSTTGY